MMQSGKIKRQTTHGFIKKWRTDDFQGLIQINPISRGSKNQLPKKPNSSKVGKNGLFFPKNL